MNMSKQMAPGGNKVGAKIINLWEGKVLLEVPSKKKKIIITNNKLYYLYEIIIIIVSVHSFSHVISIDIGWQLSASQKMTEK